MGIGKVLTISGIACALVGGFFSEIGKDVWGATKDYFNARVEIKFKDPTAKPTEVAAAKTSGSYTESIDYYSPAKQTNKRSDARDDGGTFVTDSAASYYDGSYEVPKKAPGRDIIDTYSPKPKAKRSDSKTGWYDVGSYDYSYPDKAKRSDGGSQATVSKATIAPSFIDYSSPAAQSKQKRSDYGDAKPVSYDFYPTQKQ
jgi:hypothetical protein